MEDTLYKEAILELSQYPEKQGVISNPDLEATLDNPICGDEIRMQVKLDYGKISQIRHSGNGCAISQASADLLAQSIEGKSLTEAKNLSSSDIIKLLGVNPNPARMKCALLSLDTLRKALVGR